MHDSIEVDPDAENVFLENHSPRKNSDKLYKRLRAQNGKTLPNGNRTKILSEAEAKQWLEKIAARDKRAKVEKCLELLNQAIAIAETFDSDVTAAPVVVSHQKLVTKQKPAAVDLPPKKASPNPLPVYTHTKTKRGSIVHAVPGKMPAGGWHVSALCGSSPPAKDKYGWRIPTHDGHIISCSKCLRKLPEDYERYYP
ncbi:MAG: hypothetical protein AAFN12_10955 [Cyanobacteria bacterium J06560_2]